MIRKGLLIVALLALGTVACPARGQGPELPSAPTPVVVTTLPHPPLPPAAVPVDPVPPAPLCPAGPPACAPYEDCNGPLLVGDPLLDPPGAPHPGWFTAVEVGLIAPHIKDRLVAGVNLGDQFTDVVHLPSAELDWVASPRVELGYRCAQGFGEFLISYRSIVSEGRCTITGFDLFGDGALRTRLNVNVLDLDYSSREFSLGPWWDMKWQVGARLAGVFFDSRAEGAILAQRTSNSYIGAGPHAGMDLWRRLPVYGLALFGRLEGAVLLGHLSQEFEESFGVGDFFLLGGATQQRTTQGVPVARLQAGLSWTPSWYDRCLRLAAGYELEQWWNLGTLNDSRAELTGQGAFVRFEWNF